MLKDLSLNDFLADVASTRPTPGGGSAVALAAAVGAALSVMVGNLTLKNEKYRDSEAEVLLLQDKLRPLLAKLTLYIDEDAKAFAAVIAAYKMPKDHPSRPAAIEESLKDAAALPLMVARDALTVLRLSGEMLKCGNRHAASDAAVAGRLSYAAIWGAIYSVRNNLASIKDKEFVLASRARISSIIEESELLLRHLAKAADEITAI